MSSYILEPCPCCGAAAEIKESKTHDYTVKCTNASCGMSTKKCHENVNGAVAIELREWRA